MENTCKYQPKERLQNYYNNRQVYSICRVRVLEIKEAHFIMTTRINSSGILYTHTHTHINFPYMYTVCIIMYM